MKNITIIFIVLALLLQFCSGCKAEWRGVYKFYFHNNSNYTIDFDEYFGEQLDDDFITKGLEAIIEPGKVLITSYSMRSTTREGTRIRESSWYCGTNTLPIFSLADSIRIYFNKGKSNERYVTYLKETFKPRDIKNPQEFRYEKINKSTVKVHYTFTNEDYKNAPEHENATPMPIPRCKS